MLHTPFLFLYLPLCLSLCHTHSGRLVKLGIPHGTVHSCVRQAEHPLCMPHTPSLYMGQCHTHTHTHTHLCRHRHTDKCKQRYTHVHTKWPTDTQGFSQMPGRLPQGLKLCFSHTYTHIPKHTQRENTPCSQTLCLLQSPGTQWLC